MNSMDVLPDELVLVTFSRLKTTELLSLARVSQRCRRIALDQSLWRGMKVQLADALLLSSMAPGACIDRLRVGGSIRGRENVERARVDRLLPGTRLRAKRVTIDGHVADDRKYFQAQDVLDLVSDELEELSLRRSVCLSSATTHQRIAEGRGLGATFPRLRKLELLARFTTTAIEQAAAGRKGGLGHLVMNEDVFSECLQDVLRSRCPLEELTVLNMAHVSDPDDPIWRAGDRAANRLRVLEIKNGVLRRDILGWKGLEMLIIPTVFQNIQELKTKSLGFLDFPDRDRPGRDANGQLVFKHMRKMYINDTLDPVNNPSLRFPSLEELVVSSCETPVWKWPVATNHLVFPRLRTLILEISDFEEDGMEIHDIQDCRTPMLEMAGGGSLHTLALDVSEAINNFEEEHFKEYARAYGLECYDLEAMNGTPYLFLRRPGTERTAWEIALRAPEEWSEFGDSDHVERILPADSRTPAHAGGEFVQGEVGSRE